MRGHMSPAKTGCKSSIELCELLELTKSHLFVCPIPCSHVHLYTMHVGTHCKPTFPRRLKCKGQKELGIPRAGLMTKLQDPAHSWIAARPSSNLGWKYPEIRCIWSRVPYVGHPSHPGIWDGPWFRANRDLLKPCGDTPCGLARCLDTSLQLPWCWQLRTHCCPFPEKCPWDNDSFLAQKFTHIHKTGRGPSRVRQKAEPLAHSGTNSGVVPIYIPALPAGVTGARLQPRPHPHSALPPALCCRPHCLSTDSAPSINPSHESPLRLCLRKPSSFHGSLCPYSISHIDSQIPPRLAGTLTIFRPSRWLKQPPSLHPLPWSGIIINVHQT